MTQCIIVDDDRLSRMALEQLVRQSGMLELVKSCSSALEALDILRTQPIDILLLDIEMPEVSGLELIRSLEKRPEIILVTAKEQYAREAFDLDAADYLVKPVRLERFLKAVNRVLSRQKPAEPAQSPASVRDSLYVKVQSQLVNLPVSDVLWVEATGDYVTIHTDRKSFIAHTTMHAMERRLPPERFMRVHRSAIVHLQKIKAIEESHIIIGQTLIRIGESYRDALMKRLNLL